MNTIRNYSTKFVLISLLAVFIGACGSGNDTPPTPAPIAKGTLDTSFGNGEGFITIPGALLGGNRGNAITTDASGRILIAGHSTDSAAIWRFTPDGTLDTTFGSGKGFVTHKIDDNDHATAIAVDNQGRIIIAGNAEKFTVSRNLAIWRFTPDGELDTSFGGGMGYITYNNAVGAITNNPVEDFGWSLTIDPQGKLLVAGSSQPSAGYRDLIVWRFNPDGTLDTDFAGNGIFNYRGTATENSTGVKVLLDKDNKILVAGFNNSNHSLKYGVLILRLNNNGELDTTFSDKGILSYHYAESPIASLVDNKYGFDMLVDAENRILIGGYIENWGFNDAHIAVWRFTPSGALDTRFGEGDGMMEMEIDNPPSMASVNVLAMSLDAQNNILVSGEKSNIDTGASDLALWRLNPAGVIDTSFGRDGLVTHNSKPESTIPNHDRGLAMTLAGEGKILISGYSEEPSLAINLTLWRFK